MAFPSRPIPPAKVAQGNVPMAPTRGTVAPTDLDKNTTATKPVSAAKPVGATRPVGAPRGFTRGGGRY